MWINPATWPRASLWSEGRSEGWSGAGVAASVAIFKADDVVFAQVGTALNLDQLHRNIARVGEPVAATQGDVGALVLADHLLATVFLHQS